MEEKWTIKTILGILSNSTPNEMEETFNEIQKAYGNEANIIAKNIYGAYENKNISEISELSKGVPRMVDNLGRVVILSEFRKALGIEAGDYIEMMLVDNCLVMKKNIKSCLLCNGHSSLTAVQDKHICQKCITLVSELKK